MKEMTTLCFVYGTLKGMTQGRKVADAVSQDEFILYDGGFPVAMPTTEIAHYTGFIRGEVYEINRAELAYLDHYEGYPDYYTRKKYIVNADDGTPITAWIYTGEGATVSKSLEHRAMCEPDESKFLSWPPKNHKMWGNAL